VPWHHWHPGTGRDIDVDVDVEASFVQKNETEAAIDTAASCELMHQKEGTTSADKFK